ncbi:hypothetical protein EJB05_06747, partial [Eragrostis curvula]
MQRSSETLTAGAGCSEAVLLRALNVKSEKKLTLWSRSLEKTQSVEEASKQIQSVEEASKQTPSAEWLVSKLTLWRRQVVITLHSECVY